MKSLRRSAKSCFQRHADAPASDSNQMPENGVHCGRWPSAYRRDEGASHNGAEAIDSVDQHLSDVHSTDGIHNLHIERRDRYGFRQLHLPLYATSFASVCCAQVKCTHPVSARFQEGHPFTGSSATSQAWPCLETMHLAELIRVKRNERYSVQNEICAPSCVQLSL